MAQLALKGVFQQNFWEYSDFVTNSYGESGADLGGVQGVRSPPP